jgi:myosin heavy subunit
MPPKKIPDITKILIPVWAKPGKAIWVEIMDAQELEPIEYLKGRIDQVFDEKKMISILYEECNGEKEVYAHRVLERAEEPQVLEDLVDIDPLNDAELLRCLELRFKQDDVYCFSGPTLLVTNPYKKIEKSLLPEHLAMFRKYALQGGKRSSMPHIWNLAANTFLQLFENQKKQAVCISGESGAGKTVGTKLCMAFITGLFDDIDVKKSTEEVPIEDKILACNPIMESFGNAKTVRNDNSSRFGKYFIMYVDKDDKHIKGAEIKNYLLEKSRVVIQAETERNYHVFYGILRFMKPADHKKYGYCNKGDTVDMTLFNFLRKSKCFTWETINDKEFFDDTCNSFTQMGFSADEQAGVFRMLATTLNLGNVEIDPSTYVEGDCAATFKDSHYLDEVLKQLKVEKKPLIDGFTMIRRVLQEQVIESPRSPNQSEAIRDALAKDLFNNVFNWIVRKLNLTLLPESTTKYTSVGLLDIFGFEDFEVNSIEQFCINYTNEKLANLYISYVFKAEKISFENEGLGDFLSMIKYTDNLPIIQMLDEKPFGIYHLIDSVGKVAKDDGKDDENLMSQIRKNFPESAAGYTFYHKMKPQLFGIKHTAKDVYYFSTGFVEKNRDELPGNLLTALEKADPMIMMIFNKKLRMDEVLEDKVANPMEKFLGYKFRQNMQELMDELLSCECNFVRCLKPNELKKKDLWISQLALNQVRYLGILDSIKVRRDSLPIRREYPLFYSKYQDIDDISDERNVVFVKLKEKNPDWRKISQNAVKSVDKNPNPAEVLFGKTKIFMSVLFVNKLEEILEKKQLVKRAAIEKLSKAYKVYNTAEKWEVYRERTAKVIILAKNLFNTWNSKIEYIKYKKGLEYVKRVQQNFRMTNYKRLIRQQKYATMVVGRSFRMFKIRELLFKAKKIVVTIGRCARKIMFRAFMAKLRINKRVVDDVFEISWKIIEEKMKVDASLTIQRIFRGANDRLKSTDEVAKLKLIKEEVKRTRAATGIQKMGRGFLVRTRMDRLNRAAGFIQGYTRMLWLSKYFQEMKGATKKIQVVVRKYLLKNKKTDERMGDFLTSSKQYIKNLRVVEHDVLFKQKASFDEIKNIEDYTKVKFFEDEKSFRRSIPEVPSFIPGTIFLK